MTRLSFTTSTRPFNFAELIAKADMQPSASVISDDPLDIEYLQEIISGYFPSQSVVTAFHSDFSALTSQLPSTNCKVVIARITMEGFFDFLKKAGNTDITVIALVTPIPEEVVTARLLGLEYLIKSDLSLSGNIHELFCREKAAV